MPWKSTQRSEPGRKEAVFTIIVVVVMMKMVVSGRPVWVRGQGRKGFEVGRRGQTMGMGRDGEWRV